MPGSLKWYGGTEWWEQIGLRYSGLLLASRNESLVRASLLQLLEEHPPVGFVGDTTDEVLTLQEFAERLRRETEDIENVAERERQAAAEARRAQGREKVEQALTDPALEEPVTEGRWAGFTRGEAIAWCWNLFQYEPRGLVMPGAQLRHESLRALEVGELPEVFGYPERARELADGGISPREYRRFKEALGATTFTPSDVRHR